MIYDLTEDDVKELGLRLEYFNDDVRQYVIGQMFEIRVLFEGNQRTIRTYSRSKPHGREVSFPDVDKFRKFVTAVFDEPPADQRPAIICLCGSTRFKDVFEQENARLTLEGSIVLMPGVFGHALDGGQDANVTQEQKQALDTLHKRKIDLADIVYVINVDGYIGESTQREIAYALEKGLAVTYFVPTEEEYHSHWSRLS